jgi:hypothetical protein
MPCKKCQGLMVAERQPDFSSGPIVHRCINCGLVIDPLVEQNRLNRMREKESALHAA